MTSAVHIGDAFGTNRPRHCASHISHCDPQSLHRFHDKDVDPVSVSFWFELFSEVGELRHVADANDGLVARRCVFDALWTAAVIVHPPAGLKGKESGSLPQGRDVVDS